MKRTGQGIFSGMKRAKSMTLMDFTRLDRGRNAVLSPQELQYRLSEKEAEEFQTETNFPSSWQTFSDADIGGLSTSSVRFSPEEGGKMVFEGRLSCSLTDEARESGVSRSGYAGVRANVPKAIQEIGDFSTLEITFKSDAKLYVLNVKPNTSVDEDVYEAYLSIEPEDAGEWLVAELPVENLILTGGGQVKDERIFDIGRIKGLGFALKGMQNEGDFRLEVKQMRVTNPDL
mmetsp:Transcript_6495/g.11954  ORF Transcript_6495/g.11954 Transcript_6495/m.11954 type:complete len:231 (-) Transcript_6495:47-739(-)